MTSRFIILFSAILTFAVVKTTANAESYVSPKKTTQTTTITTTTVESDGTEDDQPPPTTDSTAAPHDDNEISQNFGSLATTGLSGCKTEELSQSVVRDLKSDCSAWLKDQKSHLKDKFVTGLCEEHCSDCQMSLRRCMVTGTVRYSKAPTTKK